MSNGNNTTEKNNEETGKKKMKDSTAITIGKQIRALRGHRKKGKRTVAKISTEEFAERINTSSKCPVGNDGAKLTVTKSSVESWEKANSTPKSVMLPAICDVGNCDVGFLFGEHECSTKDLQGVVNFTGLSEESVSILAAAKQRPEERDLNYATILDKLIKQKDLLFDMYWTYMKSVNIVDSIPKVDSHKLWENMPGEAPEENKKDHLGEEWEKELRIDLYNLSIAIANFARKELAVKEAEDALSNFRKSLHIEKGE